MKDYIVRASAANAQIRCISAVTTELTEEARKRHETSPVATAALGRLLTGGAMMGSMMKNDTDMLTIQIKMFRSDRRSYSDSGQQRECQRLCS